MLYYDRIYVSEGIDVNRTRKSKECNICHYWYFLGKGIKFQPDVCNGCHDLLMMSMNLSGIAILNIKSADYHCIISGISKWGHKLNAKNRFDWKKKHYKT